MHRSTPRRGLCPATEGTTPPPTPPLRMLPVKLPRYKGLRALQPPVHREGSPDLHAWYHGAIKLPERRRISAGAERHAGLVPGAGEPAQIGTPTGGRCGGMALLCFRTRCSVLSSTTENNCNKLGDSTRSPLLGCMYFACILCTILLAREPK